MTYSIIARDSESGTYGQPVAYRTTRPRNHGQSARSNTPPGRHQRHRSLIPIGRGQRELILGDRQTCKTSLAVDTVMKQHGHNVICVYCAVGIPSSAVAKVVAGLKEHDVLDYPSVVVATGDDPPGM